MTHQKKQSSEAAVREIRQWLVFGAYMAVAREGELRVGDQLTVV